MFSLYLLDQDGGWWLPWQTGQCLHHWWKRRTGQVTLSRLQGCRWTSHSALPASWWIEKSIIQPFFNKHLPQHCAWNPLPASLSCVSWEVRSTALIQYIPPFLLKLSLHHRKLQDFFAAGPPPTSTILLTASPTSPQASMAGAVGFMETLPNLKKEIHHHLLHCVLLLSMSRQWIDIDRKLILTSF